MRTRTSVAVRHGEARKHPAMRRPRSQVTPSSAVLENLRFALRQQSPRQRPEDQHGGLPHEVVGEVLRQHADKQLESGTVDLGALLAPAND